MKQLKIKMPHIPILILSFYPENQFAPIFIKAGAYEYITKERPLDELLTAVRKVASGGIFKGRNFRKNGFLFVKI